MSGPSFNNPLFFQKALGRGFRPNKYRIVLSPPEKLKIDNKVLERISTLCKQTGIPSIDANTHQHAIGGIDEFYGPYLYVKGDLQTEWFVPTDFVTYNLFRSWRNLIVSESGLLEYPENYNGVLEIQLLNKNSEVLQSVVFEEVWPLSIGELNLAYDQNDIVATFSVVFKYQSQHIVTEV